MYGTYFRIVRWVTEHENEMKDNANGSVQAVILDMSSKCYTLGYLVPSLILFQWYHISLTILNSFYDRHDEHWHFRNCCTTGTAQRVGFSWHRSKELTCISGFVIFQFILYLTFKIFVFFQLAMTNPRQQVIHKLKLANFLDKLGRGWIFLTVGEAVDACLNSNLVSLSSCWWLYEVLNVY